MVSNNIKQDTQNIVFLQTLLWVHVSKFYTELALNIKRLFSQLTFFPRTDRLLVQQQPVAKGETNLTSHFLLFPGSETVLLERSDKAGGFSFYVSHHQLSGSFFLWKKRLVLNWLMVHFSYLLLGHWSDTRKAVYLDNSYDKGYCRHGICHLKMIHGNEHIW